ncbi:MAG: hypothetical protein LBM01_00900 [Christensenellaceae bacterium]|jgi:hypothetical protein|nr:hypothetical protein [Christensenellaceae bacterium]
MNKILNFFKNTWKYWVVGAAVAVVSIGICLGITLPQIDKDNGADMIYASDYSAVALRYMPNSEVLTNNAYLDAFWARTDAEKTNGKLELSTNGIVATSIWGKKEPVEAKTDDFETLYTVKFVSYNKSTKELKFNLMWLYEGDTNDEDEHYVEPEIYSIICEDAENLQLVEVFVGDPVGI